MMNALSSARAVESARLAIAPQPQRPYETIADFQEDLEAGKNPSPKETIAYVIETLTMRYGKFMGLPKASRAKIAKEVEDAAPHTMSRDMQWLCTALALDIEQGTFQNMKDNGVSVPY